MPGELGNWSGVGCTRGIRITGTKITNVEGKMGGWGEQPSTREDESQTTSNCPKWGPKGNFSSEVEKKTGTEEKSGPARYSFFKGRRATATKKAEMVNPCRGVLLEGPWGHNAPLCRRNKNHENRARRREKIASGEKKT